MNSNLQIKGDEVGLAQPIKWQGRSGRFYPLVQEKLDDFVLLEHDLYVIAQGDDLRWIGTVDDLISDGSSRDRFRAAVKVASSVLRFSDEKSELGRMRAAWDIEGGHLASSSSQQNSYCQ